MSVFRCVQCGAVLEDHAQLLRHVRREHGRATGGSARRDVGGREAAGGVPAEAADDAWADLQAEDIDGTAEAGELAGDTAPNSGQVIDSLAEQRLRERERQWQIIVHNREHTLGDLLDPRDEYRCDVCRRVFPHREDLDRHRWIEHRPRRRAAR